jgi:hypothetical protein
MILRFSWGGIDRTGDRLLGGREPMLLSKHPGQDLQGEASRDRAGTARHCDPNRFRLKEFGLRGARGRRRWMGD